ncbi:hypothetical protein FHX42_001659 [Saccharopolyspora lacisalsi]|uniref:Maltokinase N-terminal cap domain-containing protein n=1 Tax=Halosaccharopolyspora lacisalsi TaxID=1000566 RepID=A0A839DQQ6_9PSEU|nr:1,4-alpha-glucan branching protein [Halosaccharopolyspora lacisalsi]MBA8824312.1 hypothetical protein [Halosaccharopolyspora lacisalsi]
MPKIHPGATLTPRFSDFLPAWLAQQPWYSGSGAPSPSPIGYFRFEDPAGAVGMETHLVSTGSERYQIPMSYRSAPIGKTALRPCDADALITTAEHSVLGTRWIYDAVADPVWRNELLRLVRNEKLSEPSGRHSSAPAYARGHRLTTSEAVTEPVIELNRSIRPGTRPGGRDVIGAVMGTWYPDGDEAPPVEGCLATVRRSEPSPVRP